MLPSRPSLLSQYAGSWLCCGVGRRRCADEVTTRKDMAYSWEPRPRRQECVRCKYAGGFSLSPEDLRRGSKHRLPALNILSIAHSILVFPPQNVAQVLAGPPTCCQLVYHQAGQSCAHTSAELTIRLLSHVKQQGAHWADP